MKIKPTAVSLFAGAGGMDMGLINAGFQVIWANDINKDACKTHAIWSSATIINECISKINFNTIPQSDVIIGGFPCQGFSLAGPRKIDDKRNKLYQYFVSLVEKKQPPMFIAENVKGLLTIGNGLVMDAIIADFESKNYHVTYKLLNAVDYGVPQDRLRVIVVGIRKDISYTFVFPKEHIEKTVLKNVLPDSTPYPEDICTAPFSSRYMSRNRRRDWESPSFTIPAMAKQVPLHPSSPEMIKLSSDNWKFGEGHTRRFSWQEAALIQTFPQNMEFAGNLTSKYMQIGNAVPVKFAEAIGKEAIKIFA